MNASEIKSALEKVAGVQGVGRTAEGVWRVLLKEQSPAAQVAIANIVGKEPYDIKALNEFDLNPDEHHGRKAMRMSVPEMTFYSNRSIYAEFERHAARSAKGMIKTLQRIGEEDWKGMANLAENKKWISSTLEKKYAVAGFLVAYATCLVTETMQEHIKGATIREEFFAEEIPS